jgi:hypothetical protein
VELLIGALQEAELAGEFPFCAREERNVQRRQVEPLGELDCCLEHDRLALYCVCARPHQESFAGDRREGHRRLELRIVAAAAARVGVGPAVVEDIFAERVGFQIAGHAASELTLIVLEQEMLRQPTGLGRGRTALF